MAKKSKPSSGYAQRIAAIRALEDEYGRVTPEQLVDAARNPKNPWHSRFLWDNNKAGHRYRLDQARTFISEIRIVVTRSNKQYSSIGYLRDPNADSNKQGYVAARVLRSERDDALNSFEYEIQRLQATIERLAEVALTLGLELELEKAKRVLIDLGVHARARRGPARHEGDGDRPSL
jgi:hypothetical protein